MFITICFVATATHNKHAFYLKDDLSIEVFTKSFFDIGNGKKDCHEITKLTKLPEHFENFVD